MSNLPTNSDYLNAISLVKNGDLLDAPAGYTLLYSSSQDSSQFAGSGLIANAYYNSTTNNVIVAFYGASAFPAGVVDLQIEANSDQISGKMLAQVTAFYSKVQQAANSVPGLVLSADNTFATGNSEGGLLAELLAKDLGLSGATFGAPGIPQNPTMLLQSRSSIMWRAAIPLEILGQMPA